MMQSEIQWHKNGMVARHTGKLDIAGLMRHSEAILSDQRFDLTHYVLTDFTGIDQTSLHPEDIRILGQMYRDIIEIHAAQRPVRKWAVVGGGMDIRSLSDLFSKTVQEDFVTYRHFEDFASAQQWVGQAMDR